MSSKALKRVSILCKIRGLHGSVAEDSSLLGYGCMSDKYFSGFEGFLLGRAVQRE